MTTILVLGATGKTGRRTTRDLLAGGHAVRGGARNPGGQADGAQEVRFDWDDPSTHDAALDGVDAVYVVPPALRLDYASTVAAFYERAVAAGVTHAVMLSARGADHAPDGAMFQSEEALRATMPSWAVIRPTWFAQNFTESFFRQPIEEQGLLVVPAGQGREPWIDATDIAAVAAATLTRPELAGEVYELSGPEALDLAQTAEILGKAAGGTVTYIDADPAEWQQGLVAAGVSQDYAGLLGGLMGLIRDGHDAHLSDGVQRALGRPPRSFEEFAAAEATQLRIGAAA